MSCFLPAFDRIFAAVPFRMNRALFNSQILHSRVVCTASGWPCTRIKEIEVKLQNFRMSLKLNVCYRSETQLNLEEVIEITV